TSKQCLNTSKRDINVRSVIGANFAGIGHQGLVKLCAILNVPLPIDEDHFSDTLDYLLPTFESYTLGSMKNAVEEACKKSNGRKITASGDGTWQKRGFSSLHGVVEVLSNGPTAKVLDLGRLSKKCSICTGLLSIKYSDPKQYSEIKNKHQCEVNHVGSSGTASMEVAGIHRLFARSKMLCNVKYAQCIDYKDRRRESFFKKDATSSSEDCRISEKKNIDGKLGIRGSGRMIKKMMINFKHYYRLAIVRNKTNLDDMVRAVWAIWKHKSSSNSEPHHEWCSPSYCGYLQALEKGEEYDHTPHSLPLKIMKAIRSAFEELAHPDTLKRVRNGGSQNANESFHSILWSLAPKNRYSTGVMIDLCAAMAVSFYNDGYQSIIPVLAELTGNTGFFTRVGMKRLDERRIYYEHKRKRKAVQKSKQNEEASDSLSDRMSVDDNRDDQLDDSYIPGAY
ncbi:unnamed protein product, partial [Rotaria socialis]